MANQTLLDAVRKMRDVLPQQIAEDIMSVDLAENCPLRSALLEAARLNQGIEITYNKIVVAAFDPVC